MLPLLLLALASFSANAEGPAQSDDWSVHAQLTTVSQYHPAFDSPYSGPNSLSGAPEFDTSLTATFFLGRRLWKGADLYFNPEIVAGSGLSGTHGIAGFPNGEIFRVDTPDPKIYPSRLYFHQTFGFGGDEETLESGQNQVAGKVDRHRLTLVAGKFSLNDFFDDNSYSHDPRTQFLNWVLMDNGTWDYAADTRGYTIGIYLEYRVQDWALRWARAMVPTVANGQDLDTNISQAYGDNFEVEEDHLLAGHPGKLRFLSFLNHADMGNYRETLDTPSFNMDITQSRSYSTKYGFGLNLEQELTPALGLFSRLGWSDGATESFIFTEVDRTATVGIDLKGSAWHREQDHLGVALISDWLSKDHADYLSSGGSGFLLGDGALNYAPEQIAEWYYLFQIRREIAVTGDFQFVNHPGYNADRGPVSVVSVRIHAEI